MSCHLRYWSFYFLADDGCETGSNTEKQLTHKTLVPDFLIVCAQPRTLIHTARTVKISADSPITRMIALIEI